MDMIWLLPLILVAGTVLLLWWHRRRPEASARIVQTPPPTRQDPPYGHLLRQGENSERHAIMAIPWRIGRSSKNHLCLDDPSISRRHAEIRRREDGGIEIVDLESLNGIYINNEKIGRRQLREGDRIEIGDIVFHFHITDTETEGHGSD